MLLLKDIPTIHKDKFQLYRYFYLGISLHMKIYNNNFGLWETNPPLKLLHLPRSVLSSGQNRKNPKSRLTYTCLVNHI